MQDYSLYLVTSEITYPKDCFIQKIVEAVKGGVSIVQLRDKNACDEVFYQVALQLKKQLEPFNTPLIINDRVSIAKAIDAQGVHLGQKDMSVQKARTILKKNAIIGLSLETLNDAHKALTLDIDYVAASPVFATKTKKDTATPWGLQGLQALRRIMPLPLIAIGGINASNIQPLLKTWVNGVALVSAIMDAPSPRNAAYCLKQKIEKFSSHPSLNTISSGCMNHRAYFGAGCFWGVEATFRKIKGVTHTQVGYMGGITDNPSYEDVCTSTTNHAETVEVTYNPSQVSYEELLAVFWHCHDPTTLNRQGPDIGSQYRSVIFYVNDAQKTIAQKSKNELETSHVFKGPIVTDIQKAESFFPAEEKHQQFLEKRGHDFSEKFF